MPTHQDFPWLRDERAEEDRRTRVRGLRPRTGPSISAPPTTGGVSSWAAVWITVGLVGVVVLLVLTKTGAAGESSPVPAAGAGPSPAPVSAAAPGPATSGATATSHVRSLTHLRSRILDGGILEVWGRTTLPDGSSVRVSVSASGQGRVRLPTAPSASGRFYLRARLPVSLEGRRIRIRVRAAR